MEEFMFDKVAEYLNLAVGILNKFMGGLTFILICVPTLFLGFLVGLWVFVEYNLAGAVVSSVVLFFYCCFVARLRKSDFF